MDVIAGGVSATDRRIWTTKPLLIAYVVVVGAMAGLMLNRRPPPEEALPAATSTGQHQHGATAQREREREVTEAPSWLQLFRPSTLTARRWLSMGLPIFGPGGGGGKTRDPMPIYWTGRAADRPQTLFQVLLPFMKPKATAAAPPTPAPDRPTAAQPTPQPNPPQGETAQPPPTPPSGTTPRPAVLNNGLPLVGIYHTHDWESYISEFPALPVFGADDLGKVASHDHAKRTIVDVGRTLALKLRDLGVTTVHAPFRHQELGYDYAYQSSRETAKRILKEAPSVKIMIDLHRDSAWGLDTTADVKGEKAAKMRCVIGTKVDNASWEQNKRFCDQVMERLGKIDPELTLPTLTQEYRYNQDLLPGAILLEIGGALNQYDEAERAVGYLAEVLVAMMREGAYPH